MLSILCPQCPTRTTSKGRVVGQELKIVERCYHGHRHIDVAYCDNCGKDYFIEYTISVNKIEEVV